MSTATPPTPLPDRLDNALTSLLSRLVPAHDPRLETATQSDARWDAAYASATAQLAAPHTPPALADDVAHAAELVRRELGAGGNGRGSGDRRREEFEGLYERLLAQPVLGRKWAILYFLSLVGKSGEGGDGREGGDSVLDEAFARNGLGRVDGGRGWEEREREGLFAGRDGRTPVRPREERRDTVMEVRSRSGVVGRVKEEALLRDLPFTLQGLSSTNLVFVDEKSLKLPQTLPVPVIALLHALAEPSLLYKSLSEFVESTEGGLIGQSLRSAIGVELRSYLGLIATLESQIRRALAQMDENLPHGGLGKAGVTLKRCVVWTRDATLGLRLMSSIVEAAKHKKGGQLISLIHSYSTSHGDPFVHSFAEKLLSHVTKPFYNMLRAWIYDGELEDPYLEFFIHESDDYEDSGATSMWEHKYRLKEDMIPTIVTADFAHRVFLIGKSLNFIRHGCGDSNWVDTHSKSASRDLKHGDTALLSSSIDEAYKTVMAHLIWLMENKFDLFSHLRALKKYLLLGQGDFIALLMESLASNLDRPANSQYRHTLTAQLEHAIRNSNAQYDNADVLRRLDARMLELSHGEIGWDVFTLEYRVDSPLDVIVTPWASKQYLKVFNFLWRVKRVEFALSTTWRRLQTGARGVLGAVSDKLGADWKHARGGIAEMVHFVDQLQYYILFEVIEAGWEGLQRAIRKPDATLDTLITAHTSYLRSITRKGLLGGGGASIDFTAQLHEILKLMLAYRDAVDGLYSYSLAEFTKRRELVAKIDSRTKAGRWGLTEADDEARGRGGDSFPPPLIPLHSNEETERNSLDQLRQRLKTLEIDFRSRVNILLGDLAYQPDVDMRFLAVVMNFNEVYSPVKRRRQAKEKEKTLTKETKS